MRSESRRLQVDGARSGEHGAQLVAFHDFFFEQIAGDALEDVAVLAQDAARHVVRAG